MDGNRDGLVGGIVAAVSGGPDSVALLRWLAEGPSVGPRIVAHFNHRLRGEASDADEAFVAELAASLGWAFVSTREDIGQVAQGDNLEAVARRSRYAWLTRVAEQAGVGCVVTGHTADDQAETVLHRLLRGTGLDGLRGIAGRRPLSETVELVRPMLRVSRRDVLAFLAHLGQPYRHDASNDDRRHTRNRIRHELLPELVSEYNSGVAGVLTGLAEQAADVFAEVERLAVGLLATAERPRAGSLLVFDRSALLSASRTVRIEAMRLVWRREGWPMGGVSRAGWGRVSAVIEGELSAVDLPGRVRVGGAGRVVQVGVMSGFKSCQE